MKIQFWGATEDVTGSLTIVHLPEGKILIDCGMNQGISEVEALNAKQFPFEPEEIQYVLLTHAHLDHCGMLPRLVKKGFRGSIYTTKPTSELAKTILEDSASINDKYYDEKDVSKTIHLFKTVKWNETLELAGASIKFIPAGHILGASSIKINSEGKSVVFSGDLGRSNDMLIPPPSPCPEVDAVIMESTYGGKVRQGNPEKELHTFLMDISRNSKVGIVASFAVARAQLLLTMINNFFERHPEEKFPVYIDSPMMAEANRIYLHHSDKTLIPSELRNALKNIEVIEFQRQWESLSKKDGPILILSSSGMMTGGRISRHLENWCNDKNAVLLLPGYQGAGTPGRMFLEGSRTIPGQDGLTLQWLGSVIGSEAFSSHADQNELIDWLGTNQKVFLIHGEENSKRALRDKLTDLGKDCVIPVRNELIQI